MQIDNRYFLEFVTTAYFGGYYIKYIDRAHAQSIAKNSATLIFDNGRTPARLRYPLQKDLLKVLNDILANQDLTDKNCVIITTIFIRINNAIICLKHKNY